MAEPRADRDSADGPERGPATGTPRWVKVSGLIALVVIVLFVVVMLVGGGEHGPGRHTPPPGFKHGEQR